MKGLELARAYYEGCGKPMLQQQFAEVLPYLAIGLAGSGSECLGYDDELSRDHDFEPGFCIFLPDESVVERRTAFLLERAYAKLPRQFMGFERAPLSPVGGNRHGVMRISEFFEQKVGSPDGRLSLPQWFAVPEQGLLEATGGAVFDDALGQFSAVRERLRAFPPDVRRKKLAGHLLLMGQAGQYNYPRCIARGETGAAQLALLNFVQSAMHCLFLLAGRYMPYYKWCFRALRELQGGGQWAAPLERLICSDNADAAGKVQIIEQLCAAVADALRAQSLADIAGNDAERLAYAVNNTVQDAAVRNAHILCGV